MTTTRIYQSTDSGAPVLVGGVSSLINLLDKCLVTGYGSAPPAGWTKPFTGTDKAVFRNSVAAGGSGMYLRVVDDGSLTGGARNASIRGYSTMSGVDTGADETPSVAQQSVGCVWRKSDTVDATARAWLLFADERTFYLYSNTGTSTGGAGDSTYPAGDFASYVPADGYAWMVGGRATAAAGGTNGETTVGIYARAGLNWTAPATSQLWTGRGYSGTAGAVRHAIAMLNSSVESTGNVIGSSAVMNMTNPSLGSGDVYWQPPILAAQGTIRGVLRGIAMPLNNMTSVAVGTQYSGATGRPAGSVIQMLRHYTSTTGPGSDWMSCLAVETALEW